MPSVKYNALLYNTEAECLDSVANYLTYYEAKPQEYKNIKVPDVLLSGNHEKIAEWRREKSIEITEKNRPDLLKDKNTKK